MEDLLEDTDRAGSAPSAWPKAAADTSHLVRSVEGFSRLDTVQLSEAGLRNLKGKARATGEGPGK